MKEFYLFGDGACSGNPGAGGWGAILIYPPGDQVVELGGGESQTTNNRMEILAILTGLKRALVDADPGSSCVVHVFSDSRYAIDGASQWVHGWQRRGWMTSTGEPVKNSDLWKEFLDVLRSMPPSWRLEWNHIAAHSGLEANERCDEIAVAFAKGKAIDLYHGALKSYGVNWQTRLATGQSERPYYLSLIGGEIYRDESWPQCQARVQSARGAKYKKVKSQTEEAFVLKQWGFTKS